MPMFEVYEVVQAMLSLHHIPLSMFAYPVPDGKYAVVEHEVYSLSKQLNRLLQKESGFVGGPCPVDHLCLNCFLKHIC